MSLNRIGCRRLLAAMILLFIWATSLAAASHELTAAVAGPVTPQNWERLTQKIPDVIVTDQDGKKQRFYTDLVKGKSVAINFVFTTCVSVCPLLTDVFRTTRKILNERGGEQPQLISISVDPLNDTPQKLKAYATKFQAGTGWTFVTGDVAAIDKLLKALGAFSAKRDDHSPMVVVGNDANDRWTRSYGITPAATLVQLLGEAQSRDQAPLVSGKRTGFISGATTSNDKITLPASGKLGNASYFTNLPLITHENRPVRFYDDLIKGRIVLINTMFAGCSTACSPITRNLALVQEYLGDRVGRDIHMISITVDPLNDSPEVLKKYASAHSAKPGWTFLTGKAENVDWILYKLGGYVENKLEHNTMLIIGDESTGQWRKMIAMDKPAEIAAAVHKLADRKGQ